MAEIDINYDRLKIMNIIPHGVIDLGKMNFWHYTSFERAQQILKGGSFWASKFSTMNDLAEKNMHANADSVYCLCFCNANSESIPMWYMYSGIDGQGVALGLKPTIMLDFINAIIDNGVEGLIKETSDSCKSAPENTEIHLEYGKDFDIKCGWIFYRNTKAHNRNYYKKKWYHIDKNDLSQFEEDNYFIKDYPWNYEHEFRIAFINKTGKDFGHIKVNISSKIIKNLKARLAPENSNNSFGSKKQILVDYGIKEKSISHSLLQTKMNILDRDKSSIERYVNEQIENCNDKVIHKIKL